MHDIHKDEHNRIYHMIDALGQNVQRASDKVQSVERIVSNGLSERTIRIEAKLDAQDGKIDALIQEVHGLHRRVDGCLDKEDYDTDKRKEWDGKERRGEVRSERVWRFILTAFSIILAAVVGYML